MCFGGFHPAFFWITSKQPPKCAAGNFNRVRAPPPPAVSQPAGSEGQASGSDGASHTYLVPVAVLHLRLGEREVGRRYLRQAIGQGSTTRWPVLWFMLALLSHLTRRRVAGVEPVLSQCRALLETWDPPAPNDTSPVNRHVKRHPTSACGLTYCIKLTQMTLP